MITSRQNPLVKQFRKLHKAKERHRQGLILLEGTNLMEAIVAHSYPVEILCYTEKWQHHHPELWKQLQSLSGRSELIGGELAPYLATTPSPDGIVAIAKSRKSHPASVLVEPPPLGLGLILETIQDPGNLGTIFRTAAAAGIDRMWLSPDCASPESPKVLRASVGAWLQVSWAIHSDLPKLVSSYQGQGVQVVATSSHCDQPYWNLDFTQPTLILMGNEGAGLSSDLVTLCDQQTVIPVAPGVESLNVAIATGLMLYEARRQRG